MLAGKDIDDGLMTLNTFLEGVTFMKDKNKAPEHCSHPGLKEAAWSLLNALGFRNKVIFLSSLCPWNAT